MNYDIAQSEANETMTKYSFWLISWNWSKHSDISDLEQDGTGFNVDLVPTLTGKHTHQRGGFAETFWAEGNTCKIWFYRCALADLGQNAQSSKRPKDTERILWDPFGTQRNPGKESFILGNSVKVFHYFSRRTIPELLNNRQTNLAE